MQLNERLEKKGLEVVEGSKVLWNEMKEDVKVLQDKLKEHKVEMELINNQIRERHRTFLKDYQKEYGEIFSDVSRLTGMWQQTAETNPKGYDLVIFLNRKNHEEFRRTHQPESFQPNLGRTEC